jgi:hypothetical protein
MPWLFRTYVSPTGRNDVQKQVDKARDEIVEHFKARLRYLANTPKIDWHEPQAKKLSGVDDIYEIRFQAEKRQHRPLGFFGPGQSEFTILVWSEKKQGRYQPTDAIETAAKRRGQLLARTAQVAALTIDGEKFPPPG